MHANNICAPLKYQNMQGLEKIRTEIESKILRQSSQIYYGCTVVKSLLKDGMEISVFYNAAFPILY